ncbi:MAG TPA: 50S ribosomal protein L27 [bacterium]|nr:50S ribosomal protein L27 [bacterium]
MAHKKGQGSSRNGRDSGGQRRGVKMYDGEIAPAGSILVRQVGTRVHPGLNVGMGSDYTLFAKCAGTVKYSRLGRDKTKVSIVPLDPKLVAEAEKAAKAAR